MSAATSLPHAWILDCFLDRSSDVPTLRVRGRAGTAGAAELRRALTPLASSEERLAIDLEEVDYMSSEGLSVLEDAARVMHERGVHLELARASEAVRLAIKLSGGIQNLRIT
jgi:anti-anti-sigma factor